MAPRDAIESAPGEAPTRAAPPAWLLVALTSIGPFSLQIVLPALPAVARGFAVAVELKKRLSLRKREKEKKERK